MIVPTCNDEIPPIIELPSVFSVEIAVAGAKNGRFRTEMKRSAKEWWYGAPMLIKVRVESVSVCALGLTMGPGGGGDLE
jgi:hypothetical protein